MGSATYKSRTLIWIGEVEDGVKVVVVMVVEGLVGWLVGSGHDRIWIAGR